MTCRCDNPVRHANHRYNCCGNCLRVLNEDWLANDRTFNEFFGYLAELPDVPTGFVEQCRARERAGRLTFGNSFHGRDNEIEATEEAADFAIYMMLGQLKRRRLGRPEDRAKALEASRLVARAWQLAMELDAENHAPCV